MSDKDKPCCEVWPIILGAFDWCSLSDSTNVRLMPYVQTTAGKMRVNHCPSCGASVRGIEISTSDLNKARECLNVPQRVF
jgi:hypothetical protein